MRRVSVPQNIHHNKVQSTISAITGTEIILVGEHRAVTQNDRVLIFIVVGESQIEIFHYIGACIPIPQSSGTRLELHTILTILEVEAREKFYLSKNFVSDFCAIFEIFHIFQNSIESLELIVIL